MCRECTETLNLNGYIYSTFLIGCQIRSRKPPTLRIRCLCNILLVHLRGRGESNSRLLHSSSTSQTLYSLIFLHCHSNKSAKLLKDQYGLNQATKLKYCSKKYFLFNKK